MSSNRNNSGITDFGDLLDQEYDYAQPRRGDIRDAAILQINDSEIVVDLGVKRDGIVPTQDIERLDPDYLASLSVGAEVPVYVLNPSDREGNLLVSINLGLQGQDWKRARELMADDSVIEAEVIGHNRGGLLVSFGRLEGFVPASHVFDLPQGLSGDERRQAMDEIIGQRIGLKVIEVNQGRRRLILSQREAQREWCAQQKARLLAELSEGEVVRGRVTGIRDFGVFVDLGGADGLIHVSELAWHRVPHPSDMLSMGDEIDVYVLELDRERQRIALSLRRLQPDPWDVVEENYQIGQVVEGAVSNVVDFGAFVVLDDGVEGLLHVSEMADGSLNEPYSYVKRGDRVLIKIVRMEPERKRIGFTQRGLDLERPTDALDEQPLDQVERLPEPGLEPGDQPSVHDESPEEADALPEGRITGDAGDDLSSTEGLQPSVAA